MADGMKCVENDENDWLRSKLQFGWSRRLPVILQTEVAECGLASLAMIGSYFGHEVDLATLRRRFSTSLKGATLARVMEMAGSLSLTCRPLKLELNQIIRLKTPCILHWDLSHFVVLKRAGAGGIVIHDPASGVRKLTFEEASRHFTGVALELSPSATFKPVRDIQVTSMRALSGRVQGLAPALLQILLLALALEVFGLTGPFYLQWVLDEVVVSVDHELLTLLGLGFLGIATFSALLTAARSWAVAWLGATLNVQWSANLFAHLMRLPLDWFEKRHVGDVMSRFGSIQAIQRTLTLQFVESLLDGVMSLVTVVVMAFYSASLTLMVAGIFLAYGILRWIFFSPLRRANEEQIVYAARQQSELLESVQGVMPIKIANKQSERRNRYANATVDSANREIGIQRLNIVFALGNQLMFGLGRILLVWIAATMVLKNQLSVGMLVAFVAYADQFINRAVGLIDKGVDFRMLKLHAQRVGDVALHPPEDEEESTWEGSLPLPSIELRQVSFRYSDGDPWVFKDCNLKIEVGDSVAIVGSSGCGKTTLVKIILGLLRPTEGKVLFGGVDIRKLGLGTYRRMLGAVMQDDQLFAGTIADNISFFDRSVTAEKVQEAAKMAAIHEDISAMPMGYMTMVGDMGSSLSGGQKQRVILARALYRFPKLLVLDEATSHLDVECERLVNIAVKQMDMTRIVIAHRPETIAAMEKVIKFDNGHVCQLR